MPGRYSWPAAGAAPARRACCGAGVAVVWQDLALCDNLDIAANMLLGRERRWHLLSDTRLRASGAAASCAGWGSAWTTPRAASVPCPAGSASCWRWPGR